MHNNNTGIKSIISRKLFTLFFIVLSSLNISSCSFTPEAYESLDKTLKAYDRAIRWGDYKFARVLQKTPVVISDFQRQRLKSIKVTSYKIINKVIAPDLSKTDLIVDIRYYHDKSAVERVITDRQTWLYDETADRWQLDSPFPDFKFH